MELVKGQTLEEIVRRRAPFSATEATLIGIDLSGALAAVHAAGILHGDIKAHNVMREEGGRTVLMDFGTGRDLRRQPPGAGERVAVYPEFERSDITPLYRLRPRPLREPRFVADVHLGTLARFLRLLGFDTRYGNDVSDAELAGLTSRERRILLTRDVGLLKRKAVVRGHWLRSREPEQQLAEIVDALQLRRAFRPFTRCMTCNGVLGVIARGKVVDLVPPRVYRRFRSFKRCRDCARVYWRGTHYLRLQSLVQQVRSK
jgi:uncharacterized protein